VIGAAELVAIDQQQAALLAGPEQPMAALVVESHRTDVEVQVPHPVVVGVLRSVVTGQLQLFIGIELHGDQRIPKLSVLRIVGAVSGAHVHRTVRADGRTAASPQTSAGGRKALLLCVARS